MGYLLVTPYRLRFKWEPPDVMVKSDTVPLRLIDLEGAIMSITRLILFIICIDNLIVNQNIFIISVNNSIKLGLYIYSYLYKILYKTLVDLYY